MKLTKRGVIDPEGVRDAMRNTGLSQVGFGRLVGGAAQATVSGWVNGQPMRTWEHNLVVRLQKVSSDSARVLHLLVHSGRELEALGVCLGAPVPCMEEPE